MYYKLQKNFVKQAPEKKNTVISYYLNYKLIQS